MSFDEVSYIRNRLLGREREKKKRQGQTEGEIKLVLQV